MTRAPATAKLNLALVVGARREGGKHEVATVYQRIALCDRISLEPRRPFRVTGFDGDTLVRAALAALAAEAGVEPCWEARIDKRIPVAAGLGGGSSDAATALRLGNATLADPLSGARLETLARELGADVPAFLRNGPQLGEEDGGALTALDLPQDYWVLLVLPHEAEKASTAAVYEAFDARRGAEGFAARRAALSDALAAARGPRGLAGLPPNDLASSPLADELRSLGAFRADVSGAGPTVYALFGTRAAAREAGRRLRPRGRIWLTVPAWYV